jgi:hypothetical protein
MLEKSQKMGGTGSGTATATAIAIAADSENMKSAQANTNTNTTTATPALAPEPEPEPVNQIDLKCAYFQMRKWEQIYDLLHAVARARQWKEADYGDESQPHEIYLYKHKRNAK